MARIRHQLATTYGAEVINLLSGLTFGVIAARQLAPEGRGLTAAAMASVSVALIVASAGINKALIPRLSRPVEGMKRQDYYAALLLSFPIVFLAAEAIIAWSLPALPANIRLTVWLILTLSVPAQYLADIGRIILRIRDRLVFINALQAIVAVLRVSAILVLLAFKAVTVPSVLLIELGCAAIIAISLLTILRVSWLRIPDFSRAWPALLGLLSYGVSFQIYSVSIGLINKLMILNVHRLSGDAATGLFAVGMRLAEYVGTLSNGITLVMVPILARMTTSKEAYTSTSQLMRLMVLVIGPVCTALIFCAGFGIPLVYGSGYEGSIPAFRVMIFAVFAMVMFQFSAMAGAALGRTRLLAGCAVAGLAVSLVTGFFLIPRFGSDGAAISAALGHGAALMSHLIALHYLEGVSVSSMLKPRRADLRLLFGLIWPGNRVSKPSSL